MIDKIRHYFLETLWNFSLEEKEGKARIFLKWLRIVFLTIRGFIKDQCSLRASSLTYYTIMSIVPTLALAFWVAGGFGFYERLRGQLLAGFPDQQEAFTEIFSYADKLLMQTRGGIVAVFGIAVLILSVIFLLSSLEGILNHIWKVKKLRTWWRIFTDYMAFVVLAPIFFVSGNSLSFVLIQKAEELIHALPLSKMAIEWLVFSIHLLPLGLFWILFTFLYYFIPNTKVQFSSALLAGVFGGTFYLIVQWGYVYFQVGVARYGAIYGSVAAVPLFLVWLQISWSLFLLGAELSYAHQTLDEHEYEKPIGRVSDRLRKLISLWMLHLAITKKAISIKVLSQEKIPKGLAKPILKELVECKLLAKQKSEYTPAPEIFEMKISDCLIVLETKGVNRFPFLDSSEFSVLESIFEEFEKSIQYSPKNMRLKDVSHSV